MISSAREINPRACVEIMRQLHGKRVYAANLRMLIIPSGSFVYFQIPSFVWFGIGAMFVLALAKGEITWDVIKKMDTALFWREQWSLLYESITITPVIRAMWDHKSLFEIFSLISIFSGSKYLFTELTSPVLIYIVPPECIILIAYVCVHMWNYWHEQWIPCSWERDNLTPEHKLNAKWTIVRQFTRQAITL